MLFYLWLNRLFPNSFTAKVFFVAFIGTHVPLIAAVFYALARTGGLAAHLDVLGLLLAATLVGCGATLAGLWALLTPTRRIHATLTAIERGEARAPLREDIRDEMGLLMRGTNAMAASIERRQAQDQVAILTDPLTGVANRRGFDAHVPDTGTGAVVFIDLDHFKRINDTLGHATGDAVLKETARVIAGEVRQRDVLARFGGEEFVIWLPEASSEDAWRVGERVRAVISETLDAGGQPVTASVGLAVGEGPTAIKALLDRADEALYAAKDGGRNKVVESISGPAETGGFTFAPAPLQHAAG
ncbi:diguanylate cyclase [Mameliella alba]|uniref:diguanylate cyclase n=1 Tax=Mameliella alba TaxID=561184 RepID=UPI001C942C6D|nr:diguanylate cyclase [Mameliella alba]MBY6117595.1 diguanylate cyclase [Mameliella alba]